MPEPHKPEQEVALITASELAAALETDEPPLVLEAVMGGAAPGASFVPGAVLLDLVAIDVYEETADGSPLPSDGNYCLRPAGALRLALEQHGVRADRRCVVYTQCRRHTQTARATGMRGHHHRYRPAAEREGVADPIVAARLVWCLAYAGVERVALLDGGMSSWRALELPTSDVPSSSQTTDFYAGSTAMESSRFPRHPEFCATADEVAAGAPPLLLGDVRSWSEFRGDGHDYAYELPHGRIPGSRWARWGPSTFVGSDYYELSSGALRPLAEVAATWRRGGLLLSDDPGDDAGGGADASAERARLVFYCGSGWRSSLAWLYARLMGHRDVASFDGSLLGWSADPARPLVCGDPGDATTTVVARGARPLAGQPQPALGWAVSAAACEDSFDDGPAGRQQERQRQRERRAAAAAAEQKARQQQRAAASGGAPAAAAGAGRLQPQPTGVPDRTGA